MVLNDDNWSRKLQKKEKKKLDLLLTTLPRKKTPLDLAFSLTRRIIYDQKNKPQYHGFIFLLERGDPGTVTGQAPLTGLLSLVNNAEQPGGFIIKQLLNVFLSLLTQSTYLPSLIYVSSGRLLRALTPFAIYLKIPLVQRLSETMIAVQDSVNRIETGHNNKTYIHSTSGYLDVPEVDLDLFTLFIHMSNKFTISKAQHLLNSGNVFEIKLPLPLHNIAKKENTSKTTKKEKESQGFTQPGVVYVRVLGASGHCLPSLNICFDIRDNIMTPETTKYGTFSEYGELHFATEPVMQQDFHCTGLSEVDVQHMLEYGIFVSQRNPDLFSVVKRVDSQTGEVHISKRFPTAREMMITCYVLHCVSELARTQGHICPKTKNLTTNVAVADDSSDSEKATLPPPLYSCKGRNNPILPCQSRPTERYYLPINQRYLHPTTCINVTQDSILTPPVGWKGEGTRSWTDEDRFPTIKGIPPIDSSFVNILQNLMKRHSAFWQDTKEASIATIDAAFPKRKKQWKVTMKLTSQYREHPELFHGDQPYGHGRSCFNIQETDWNGKHPVTRKNYNKKIFGPNGGGYFQHYIENKRGLTPYEEVPVGSPMIGASEYASPHVVAAAINGFVTVDGNTAEECRICHWCAKFAWQISKEDSTFTKMTKCVSAE